MPPKRRKWNATTEHFSASTKAPPPPRPASALPHNPDLAGLLAIPAGEYPCVSPDDLLDAEQQAQIEALRAIPRMRDVVYSRVENLIRKNIKTLGMGLTEYERKALTAAGLPH